MTKRELRNAIIAMAAISMIIVLIIGAMCWMGRIQYKETLHGSEKEVAWTELNVRDEAGTNNTNVITTLDEGDVVCLTGRLRDTNIGAPVEYRWVEVTYGNITGWVRYDALAS